MHSLMNLSRQSSPSGHQPGHFIPDPTPTITLSMPALLLPTPDKHWSFCCLGSPWTKSFLFYLQSSGIILCNADARHPYTSEESHQPCPSLAGFIPMHALVPSPAPSRTPGTWWALQKTLVEREHWWLTSSAQSFLPSERPQESQGCVLLDASVLS